MANDDEHPAEKIPAGMQHGMVISADNWDIDVWVVIEGASSHGVVITGNNVNVRGVTTTASGGDGFLVGGEGNSRIESCAAIGNAGAGFCGHDHRPSDG